MAKFKWKSSVNMDVCPTCGGILTSYAGEFVICSSCVMDEVIRLQKFSKEVDRSTKRIDKKVDREVEQAHKILQILAQRDETIRLLKEDGERLAGKLSDRSGVLDGDYIRCYFCGRRTDFDTVSTMQHDPDCPITLHNDLYKRLEG